MIPSVLEKVWGCIEYFALVVGYRSHKPVIDKTGENESPHDTADRRA